MKRAIITACLLLLAGCTAFEAPKVENTHLYLLDARVAVDPARHPSNLVLAVGMPSARPGFDTPRMAYQKQPLALEYFAYHRWADTPPRMLRPLIAQALERKFRTVVSSPGTVIADLKLDTELVRLQQNFATQPSRIQLGLRAQLIDVKTRRIIATHLFEDSEAAVSDDPYGGVVAANLALQRILAQLGDFCLDASATP